MVNGDLTKDLQSPAVGAAPCCLSVIVKDLRFSWPKGSFKLSVDDFCLAAGEKVFISGPSGCGKSTLLGLISGILKPQAGEVVLDGQSLSPLGGPARDRLRGDKIGYIFQQFNLVPYLGVVENVVLPCRFSKLRSQAAIQGFGSERAAALEILERLGLEKELLDRKVTALSVGQQQRVAAARALMGRPPLLIADEPTSALDRDLRLSFLSLLVQECRKSKTGLLFVSHDSSLASVFDREISFPSLNKANQPLKALP
jgi:putative ABC transport system ATP-binding protein